MAFENFYGNARIADTLAGMIAGQRIPQTILLAGPEGIGKATLARRFAQRLLPHPERIEQDDLSLPDNIALVSDREKLASEKRNEDPLLFSSHPDFVTFAPDGPLRQISIQQMRLFKERAQYKPLQGSRRVFLIDHIDRANEQAANSLLKVLEEPPEHLIVFATAENAYDLLPTIRSRSLVFHMTPLGEDEMSAFVKARDLKEGNKRIALAGGSPGVAFSLDMDVYQARREAMLTLLEVAAGAAPFSRWVKYSESIGARKTEKLEQYLRILYLLLDDVVALRYGSASLRNPDVHKQLQALAERIDFSWLHAAVKRVDDIADNIRRNVQKSIALDAFAVELRPNSARVV